MSLLDSDTKEIAKIMTFQAGFSNTTRGLVGQPDSPALNLRHWLSQYCCVRMLKQSNVLIPLQCFTGNQLNIKLRLCLGLYPYLV